ncbi:MAG: MOSC domain-containing protein, partial [Pseudonocardiaceae bacterium]
HPPGRDEGSEPPQGRRRPYLHRKDLPMPTLVSVNMGMPRDVAWNGVTVHTGAWKDPVDGARLVRRLGMDGDGQGDTYGHGGPNRAVLVYQSESYDHWREHFGRNDLGPGVFAENLTVDGLGDADVCIGDRYRIGEAEFEVSQPRVTCYRAGLRIGEPQLAALLVAHHRPGFYMRVITEGRVQAGDEIIRTATGSGQVSVAAVDALLYLPEPDLETVRRAVDIPALSSGWQGSLRKLLDGATNAETPSPVTAEPAWAGFRTLQVAGVVHESPTVASISLTDPDGAPLPAARPGQYLTVRVPAGPGGAVRSYSLSSAPSSDTYRISVKREPSGLVSSYIHDSVRPGTQLQVAAPRGEFVLEDDTRPVVLVSAGIGITPMLAMLHWLAAERNERQVWWLHATRHPSEEAFSAETHALFGTLPHARASIYYSAADDLPASPTNSVLGRLSTDRLIAHQLPPDAVAYICGPTKFMTDMTIGLQTAGLDPGNIHTETFGTLAPINPGVVEHARRSPHQPGGTPGTGPMVTFVRSGVSAPFNTTRSSLLEFAETCDVPVRWQCRTGVCRTCETGLLAGDVDYAPAPLDTPPAGTVLPCCARPTTDLFLDM